MKRNYLIKGLVALIVIAIVGYALINLKGEPTAAPDDKVSVVTSFYPLYFFANEIGGSLAHITNITPAGAEPHDYEPTARDIANIHDSQLLILNGGGLEAWSDDVQKDLDTAKTTVITAGQSLTNQKFQDEGEMLTDPHVWLSPPLTKKIVDEITAGFVEVDPGNQDYYEANAEALKVKLTYLDKEYRNSLKNCKQKSIVTSHNAFGYLAAAYGLKQVSITGLSPDEEPSARQLTEVADFARKNGVKYIFFESLVSPKLSETVANEIGAQTLVLNPLEGLSEGELAAGKNYLTEMMSNLDNLKIALECTK